MFVKSRLYWASRTSAWALAAGLLVLSASAVVAEDAKRPYNIEAKSTAAALNEYARQSGVVIMFDYGEANKTTAPVVNGTYTPKEALALLLANTRFVVASDANGAVYLKVSERQGSGTVTTAEAELTEVIVTGTRIRGREPASPVVRVTQEQMRLAGQSDLGELARALPQSFGGGSNPGIAVGTPDLRNSNNNAASSFNLRGLGPDATLTLLNGNRLAYDSIGQAVDVSAIPLAAVDRVEIVTDGASALYGSDAVGGVANIILKRDFSGVDLLARYAGSTAGGNIQRQISLTGGTTWSNGGFIATFDTTENDGLFAKDRDYTRALDATSTLIPAQKARLLLVSGHQRLTDNLKLSLDAVVSERKSVFTKPNDVGVTYLDYGSRETPRLTSFSVSPRLTADLGKTWQAYWTATVGEDRTTLQTEAYFLGERTATYPGRYFNRTFVTEVGAEGRAFDTRAGTARLAVGAGYREIGLEGYLAFDYVSGLSIVATDFDESRTSRYAFAELYMPLVATDQAIPGIHQISLTTAVRHEAYAGLDAMTTPKVGLIYQPVPGFDVKLSWGKSFKVPTLYQTYRGNLPYLFDTALISTQAPANTTFLNLDGGNTDLKAETAESKVVTFVARPHWLQGGRIELSGFAIDYSDRVMQPILSLSGSLENPAYLGSVSLNPTLAQVSAALGDPARLRNYASVPYDPATVFAIVDNREQNVYRQEIRGVDLSGDYTRTAGTGALRLTGSVSYLQTRQRLNANNATLELAGTIFNPPHWRGRAGATWATEALSLAGFLNYTGNFDDPRFGSEMRIPAQTTYDATLRYRVQASGGATQGVTLTLSVLNLFDETPETIRTAAPFYVPYDATNHAATGRVVSLTVGKRW